MKFIVTLLFVTAPLLATDFNNKIVRIEPSHSNKCLNTLDKSNEGGALIVQWTCSNQDHQRFQISQNSDGYYAIRSTGSELCFGVPYAFTGSNGLTLIQTGCAPGAHGSNEFTFVVGPDGLHTIRPRRAPESCLGVVNASKDSFASVVQEKCTNKPSQLFYLVQQ